MKQIRRQLQTSSGAIMGLYATNPIITPNPLITPNLVKVKFCQKQILKCEFTFTIMSLYVTIPLILL